MSSQSKRGSEGYLQQIPEFVPRPEMEPLNFLLGGWSGSTIVYPDNGVGPGMVGEIVGEIRPSLDGAFYEWHYTHRPSLQESLIRRARYSFGYSGGHDRLIALYADDHGNAFTEIAGARNWINERLAFAGDMSMRGRGDVSFVDEFTRISANEFKNTVTMTIAGRSHLHGVLEVRRTAGWPLS